jgi:hypothetical protein
MNDTVWTATRTGELVFCPECLAEDSVEKIAKDLKRTPSAVRQKATSLGISVRARSR